MKRRATTATPIPTIPSEGFLRANQIFRSKKHAGPAVLPISESSFWKKVKSGEFPPGLMLGPRTRVWPIEQVRAYIARMSTGASL